MSRKTGRPVAAIILAAAFTVTGAGLGTPVAVASSGQIVHTCASPYRDFHFLGDYSGALPQTVHPGEKVSVTAGELVATLPVDEVDTLRSKGVTTLTLRFFMVQLVSTNETEEQHHQLLADIREFDKVPLPTPSDRMTFHVPQTFFDRPQVTAGPVGSKITLASDDFFVQMLGFDESGGQAVNLTGSCVPSERPIIASVAVT
jgi:hypothetical protein